MRDGLSVADLISLAAVAAFVAAVCRVAAALG